MLFDKPAVIAMHQAEFEKWEALLARLNTEQMTMPARTNGLSVKDTMAHLAAWQQRTIARLEAGLHGHEPRFPRWPVELGDVETDEDVNRANAWIQETNRDRPWNDVYQEWRRGFLRFLELLREVPEMEMRPQGKLVWLAEYEPLEGHADTFDYHHARHRGPLEAWVREHGAR